MSLPDLATVEVDLQPAYVVEVWSPDPPDLVEVPGPPGPWQQLTQAEYDALDPPDPNVLYVIVG